MLFCAACLHRVPPQRLASPQPIAVTMLEDRGDDTRGLPASVNERIAQELEERNLVIHDLAPEPMLGGTHNSQQRFAALQNNAGDAGFSLLIETRVAYYDLLEGQYRWVVYAKLTAGRRVVPGAPGQAQPATDVTEIPVFLQFAHQKEDAALDEAARVLAERSAALIDGFIAPPREPGAPAGPANPFAPPSVTPTGSSRVDAPPDAQPRGDAMRALGNIYFVMIDRFADGDRANDHAIDLRDPDAFHGGDLQGVLDKLDTLQKLGVQTIWLSPVFATRQEKFFGHGAYHGYWVEDLGRVEPRFGDLALLEKLSNQLHQRGMKLLLDLVLNHVAFDSPLLKTHPDWFHHNGSIEDWNDARQLEERDVDGLPDLAQENEQVYQMLLADSLRWIDSVHPDGFRLDAVKHVPLAFWQRFDAEVHAHAGPGFVMLGEALEGSPSKLAKLERGGGFDSLFDFPLGFALTDVFCKGAAPERLAAVLSQDRLYADANSLATLVDNHDLPRARSLCGGDDSKVEQLIAALGFMRGVPAIQYGTEAALTGEKEPANRGDLFDRTDARAGRAVAQALHMHAAFPELQSGRTLILDAGQGAVALVRFNDDAATLFLFAQPGAASQAVAASSHASAGSQPTAATSQARIDALKPFSTAKLERCEAHAASGATAGNCTLAFAPGELRIARLRPAKPAGFAALVSAAQPRDVAFHLGASRPNPLAGSLFVAGAGPELGDWDPAHALGPLSSDATAALPTTIRFPTRSVIEYKLILKRPDGSVQWESGPDRFLFVSEAAGPLDVALAFRS